MSIMMHIEKSREILLLWKNTFDGDFCFTDEPIFERHFEVYLVEELIVYKSFQKFKEKAFVIKASLINVL